MISYCLRAGREVLLLGTNYMETYQDSLCILDVANIFAKDRQGSHWTW
jgi:hypothetical protein